MTKKIDNEEWGNIELPGLSDEKLFNTRWSQVAALKGRKRPNQSLKMAGENNPMYGREHPNKGKSLPIISEKIKGKSKTDIHKENISKARKDLGLGNTWGGKERPEHSDIMKDPNRNKGAEYMREIMTCPHCGKIANGPNYKRWHGDNCKHK